MFQQYVMLFNVSLVIICVLIVVPAIDEPIILWETIFAETEKALRFACAF